MENREERRARHKDEQESKLAMLVIIQDVKFGLCLC